MRKLPAVSIDLEIIIDPYKVLSIINCIDKSISEIVVPFSLQHLTVTGAKWREEVDLFEDSYVYLENAFGFDKGITRNNFIAGFELLRLAHKKGMVRLLDVGESSIYENVGLEVLKAFDKEIIPYMIHDRDGSGSNVLISPDWLVYETLIGLQTAGIVTVTGSINFKKEIEGLMPDSKVIINEYNISRALQKRIILPKLYTIQDAFNYASSKHFFNRLKFDFDKSMDNDSVRNGITLLSLEFGSSLFMDSVLFKGLPISSSSIFLYKLIKTSISKNDTKKFVE